MTLKPEAFVRANTILATPALVPEITLHHASEITPIWQATEDWLRETNTQPPFWAFAWPGSIALARHILDHPHLVAGKRVLDFAAGGGLAAIAAHRAGATHVQAAEIDPIAIAAIALNAAQNQAAIHPTFADLVGQQCQWDLILCGDVCYEAPMTNHILPWLKTMAQSATVWIADPGRTYAPTTGLTRFATYTVPTTQELEDHPSRTVTLALLGP